MSHTTKLSTKGQVVLPKSLRTAHRWKAGTEFLVQEHGKGILLVPKRGSKSVTWDELRGSLPYSGRPKSLREMDQAIATEARSRK
ncbi:MAG: AbrB/MazE/SpoVT family DNA-binding domain-containing protein [Candidatus Korobacteraceae bacterium]